MLSLPAPPARRLMSLAFSLIIPRLNSSLGSSALPARIVSLSFWLSCATSRSRSVAALDPEAADEEAFEGMLGILRPAKADGTDGCVVAGGWVDGVEDVPPLRGFEAGVDGVLPAFMKPRKDAIVAYSSICLTARNDPVLLES
jgi:hypothetical protein